jgi:hypothetical protein
MKGLQCTLIGTRPLLLHNGAQANPLNPYVKAMREITGKRTKTDQDLERLAEIEWTASLYLAEVEPGQGLRIVMPGANVEGMIAEAGRQERKGKAIKAGVICYGPFPIEYDGPPEPRKLWEAGDRWRLVSTPPIRGNRVVRTRPKFDAWRITIQVYYEPGVISEGVLKGMVEKAGSLIGLGDWRPRYGTFRVSDWQAIPSIEWGQGVGPEL